MEYTNPFLNPTGSVTDFVVGSGGSTRHVGNFTEDNSYYQQLLAIEQNGGYGNTNNQDLDALYERAVEEQARLDNLAMTEELNWRKLQEQREYDSDVQRVARARAAGINLDLAGGSGSSSGGSSSASMPATNIEPVQGQTKFSNSYDTTSLVFSGISAAGSLISSLSSVAGTVMNGISQFRLLGPQTDLMNAQAGLASATANEVNTLLDGKKTAQDISNSSAYLNQLAEVAQLTSLDTKDEVLTPFLASIGLSDKQMEGAMSVVREMQNHPEQLAKYYSDKNSLRANKLYNELYTENYLREFMRVEQSVANNQIQSEFYLSSIQRTIDEIIFNDDRYASNLAETQIVGSAVGLDQARLSQDSIPLQRSELEYDTQSLELVKKQLEVDIESFMKSLELRQDYISRLCQKRQALLDKAGNRPFTHLELSMYDSITAEIGALESLNASQFAEMHKHFMRGSFVNSQRNMIDDYGHLRSTDSFRQSLWNMSSTTYFALFPHGMTIEDRKLVDRDFVQRRREYMQNWVNIGMQFINGYRMADAVGNRNRR